MVQWKAVNFSLSESQRREAELAGQCQQLEGKYARLRIWATGILTQLQTAVERCAGDVLAYRRSLTVLA